MAEGFVGLAFGVSGVFTLVNRCLSIYRHIDEAGGFGENVLEQYVMFQHESARFNAWQKDMRDFHTKSSTDATISSRMDPERPNADNLMHSILAQVVAILQTVQKLCDKYKVDQPKNPGHRPEKADVPSISTGVATTAIGSAVASDGKMAVFSLKKQQKESSLKGRTGLLKRILYGATLWRESDKAELQQSIARFAYWNNCLQDFLPSTRGMLLDLSTSSALLEGELDPGNLRSIKAAASTGLYESLARRAKLRQMSLEPKPGPSLKKDTKCLDEKDINRILSVNKGVATFSEPGKAPVKCLVEWKSCADLTDYDSILAAESQVEDLVKLLNFGKKPATMDVLEAFGYFQYEYQDHRLFGFISAFPPKTDANNAPVSLNDLLVDVTKPKRSHPLPSLPQRVRMAQRLAITLLELHNVEWLHKDLNSRNILFFYNSLATLDLGTPWVTGFEFARPDDISALSFSVRASSMNMYRHPSLLGPFAPGQKRPRFQRIHDIYSVGVLLLEIGLWKQVGDFRKPNMKPSGFATTLKQLAHRELPHRMGEVYRDVVLRCMDGEGLYISGEQHEDDDEDDDAQNKREGRNASLVKFYWSVVRELERCHCK
ncbi:hypothetical protein K458DRAFT_489753 [Lentithecium fluviatile CBS 122367]|uniref:Protein kinase domain-containing protein n=1 Tax=Lentithecium fluviatile CBS 122367 TaxID=1168545 RepID=A0A6G1IRN7_9PLEO|nr:hypothetical protein K458DRAFT_489753 [Lentithecium fluviatile CBS 122367]